MLGVVTIEAKQIGLRQQRREEVVVGIEGNREPIAPSSHLGAAPPHDLLGSQPLGTLVHKQQSNAVHLQPPLHPFCHHLQQRVEVCALHNHGAGLTQYLQLQPGVKGCVVGRFSAWVKVGEAIGQRVQPKPLGDPHRFVGGSAHLLLRVSFRKPHQLGGGLKQLFQVVGLGVGQCLRDLFAQNHRANGLRSGCALASSLGALQHLTKLPLLGQALVQRRETDAEKFLGQIRQVATSFGHAAIQLRHPRIVHGPEHQFTHIEEQRSDKNLFALRMRQAAREVAGLHRSMERAGQGLEQPWARLLIGKGFDDHRGHGDRKDPAHTEQDDGSTHRGDGQGPRVVVGAVCHSQHQRGQVGVFENHLCELVGRGVRVGGKGAQLAEHTAEQRQVHAVDPTEPVCKLHGPKRRGFNGGAVGWQLSFASVQMTPRFGQLQVEAIH